MDIAAAEATPKVTYSALNEIVWTSATAGWVIPLEHSTQFKFGSLTKLAHRW